MDRIRRILFPLNCREALIDHCRRKLAEDYLPEEAPERKAYGLIAGLPTTDDEIEVQRVFPLKRNLRTAKQHREQMDALLERYGVPSETPFEKRGWVADPDELMKIYNECDDQGLWVFGTYHMHRVGWKHDPLRDTCTEIDTVLARDSNLWVFIVSMVRPEQPIVRAFWEGNNDKEAPIVFTSV